MKHNVLFLCSGNSCRSQMAEAFLRHYASDRFEVLSAGLVPRPIHPMTFEVMRERGFPMSDHTSKDSKSVLGKLSVRYVIFVCHEAERDCPRIFPFATQRLSWPFEDPALFEGTETERREKFRAVRDAIEDRVQGWLQEVHRDEQTS